MSHIYWERHEIPIPDGCYTNNSDGRVFTMKRDAQNIRRRTVIGHATSETTMHPNETFRFLYPALWKENYGDDSICPHELHAGLYAATLGIGYKTQLYPILHKVYGPLYGNAIMDYSMYSILERSDTTQLFSDRMSDQVLYSGKAYSDSWYSDLFKNRMSPSLNHTFRMEWLRQCVKEGDRKVWISIDGSNNDCNVSGSILAEHGKAKSHTGSRLVSFIWAISASTGRPVTWYVNDGSVSDGKAFQLVEALLKSSGIEIEGVIIDRGFCSHDVVEALQKSGHKYILMLKTDTFAHTSMMSEYADTIRWKVPYAVTDNGIFGITRKRKLFAQFKDEAYINLYFDASNGTDRSITLISKVREAEREANQAISEGKQATIPQELKAFLSVLESSNGTKIICNYDAWQNAVNCKGFSSIASSDDIGAAEVNRLYHLRDASEKQFMIMKSQMGFDTTRVHSDSSIEGRFAVCFIAAIIRSELMNSCKKLKYDTNRMIRELNRISFILMLNGTYESISNHTIRQKELLKEIEITENDFPVFAQDVNMRLSSSISSQIHRLADDPKRTQRKKPGPVPKKKVDENNPKRKPGRPKGSKNKKTLERESVKASAKAVQDSAVEKRKPGRPKGSKNKPQNEEPLKRKPGRPKGSKNKPKNTKDGISIKDETS